MKEKKEGPAASTPVASTITRVKVLDKRHLCEICLRDSEDEELCTECDKNIPCKIYAFRGNDALRIMLDDAEFDNRNLSKEDEAQLLMMLECPTVREYLGEFYEEYVEMTHEEACLSLRNYQKDNERFGNYAMTYSLQDWIAYKREEFYQTREMKLGIYHRRMEGILRNLFLSPEEINVLTEDDIKDDYIIIRTLRNTYVV